MVLIFSFLFSTLLHAEPSSTRPKLKYGDRVRFAKCGDPAQQYWKSTGYPNAVRVDRAECGKRGVVVGSGRACGPGIYSNSCDPWKHFIKMDGTGDRVEAYEAEFGLGKRKDLTLMDVLCGPKKKKCEPKMEK